VEDAAADSSEATVIGEIDGETFLNGYKQIRCCNHVLKYTQSYTHIPYFSDGCCV